MLTAYSLYTLVAVLFLIGITVAATIFFVKRSLKAQAIAEEDAQLEKEMTEEFDEYRNAPFRLAANGGRIRGFINKDHEIQWINICDKDGKVLSTYTRLKEIITTGNITKAEILELEAIGRALDRFRDHGKKEKLIPVGFYDRSFPGLSVRQYMAGVWKIGDRNKMAVKFTVDKSRKVIIQDVRLAIDLTLHDPVLVDVSTEAGRAHFKKLFFEDKGQYAEFKEEYDEFERIEASIKKYNEHVHELVFDAKNEHVLYYRPTPPAAPSDAESVTNKEDYANMGSVKS